MEATACARCSFHRTLCTLKGRRRSRESTLAVSDEAFVHAKYHPGYWIGGRKEFALNPWSAPLRWSKVVLSLP